MNRRQFLLLAAGIVAASRLTKDTEEGSIGWDPAKPGSDKTVVQVLFNHHRNIYRLVNVKGIARKGDLLFWTDTPNTVANYSEYNRDLNDRFLSNRDGLIGDGKIGVMAGYHSGMSGTGKTWMLIRSI